MIGLGGFWNANLIFASIKVIVQLLSDDAMKYQNALDNYFLLLKSILDDNGLKDNPGQI